MSAESVTLTADDIAAAYARIHSRIRRTPLLPLTDGEFPHPVELKLEFLQHAGSFKARGAFANLLRQPVPPVGVAAASGGNHGVAVAYAAKTLGVAVRVFVPEIASPAKVAAIVAQGATIVIGGQRYADAQEACDRYVAQSGALLVHPFSAWPTMAGAGTVALEWAAQRRAEDRADLQTVLVAVGGGGLAAGMAAYFSGTSGARVIGVEPVGSRALGAALDAGGPVDVAVESVAADSLGARNIGPLVYAQARAAGLTAITVDDPAIVAAQRWAWERLRVAVEPGGAAALAALLSGAYRPRTDERVGVLLCGANVDLHKIPHLMLILDRLKHILYYPLVHLAAGPLTLTTLLVGLSIIIAARFTATLVGHGLTRMLTRREVHASARFAVVKIARYIVISLGVIIAITSVGLKMDALLEASAALLVGIGFGLQTIAQNFISGLILLIERPVGMGDFVQIGNASGTVVDIGLRATTVVTRDEVTIIVPNSELITGQVINHSIPTPRRRIAVNVGVAYGTDTQAVKRVLLEVAAASPAVLTDPAPDIRFDSFGDSTLNFILLAWIASPSQDLRTASELRFAIEAAFHKAGITIPFPQRELHLRSGALGVQNPPKK